MKNWGWGLVLIGVVSLTGCATTTQTGPQTITSYSQLQHLSGQKISPLGGINAIRDEALQETAMSIGARAGLAWRAKQIDNILTAQSNSLDKIYDFRQMLINGKVLPPVIVEGRNTLNLANNRTLRMSDRTYEIVQQAKYVTAPPTWREYLWMNYPAPSTPDTTLLPRNKKERKIWEKAAKQGWADGIKQADVIFQANLDRLQRDYKGMARYRALLAQNMVTKPYTAQTQLGVTGGGKKMSVDDRIARITELPALNAASNTWRTAVATQATEQQYLKSPTERDPYEQRLPFSK